MKIALVLICFGCLLTGCVDQSVSEKQEVENKRIVVTSVTVCEILDALEIDNVVGVPESTSYELPHSYENARIVGGAMSPDMEIVAELEPDYILSPKSLESDLGVKYDNAGIESFFLDLSSTEKMYGSIVELGQLLGAEEKALALEQKFQDYMEQYRESKLVEDGPKVLLLMGLPGSYVVATDASYAGSLVALAGGENVYGQEEEAFLNVNPEDMLQKEPDIILLTSHAMPEQVEKMFEDEFTQNDIWKHFQAAENGRVFTLDHNKFGMSANFEYQEALSDLQEIFYETEE